MSFETSFEKMILREGGYVLHKIKHDRGGSTYAGIARNFWPTWEGWKHLDKGEKPPKSLVKAFYKTHFWDKIKGDALHEEVAETIFDFAVNAGVKTASKLAQNTVGATVDGFIGRQSIAL
ncbi:MAG: glycosyl hydrolase 108 family protein, partial [Pseudomonadota bacterium]|nr:glycosyl hydrolase 108 family protein [Pseudomonadota bacterium]